MLKVWREGDDESTSEEKSFSKVMMGHSDQLTLLHHFCTITSRQDTQVKGIILYFAHTLVLLVSNTEGECVYAWYPVILVEKTLCKGREERGTGSFRSIETRHWRRRSREGGEGGESLSAQQEKRRTADSFPRCVFPLAAFPSSLLSLPSSLPFLD